MNAFRATYADWKLIKTRGVVQVIFEVPLADHDVAYGVLGGMPDPAKERWFGIAPLISQQAEKEKSNAARLIPAQPQPIPPAGAKRDKRNWRDVPPSEQAGMCCDEPSFSAFLREQRSDDWRESPDAVDCVYLICGISSRSELGTNQKARVIWHQLDTQYAAWKVMERA